MRFVCLWQWLGKGLQGGCKWHGVPDQDTGPFLWGAAGSGQATAEAGALLGTSPWGLPVQPPGPAPKKMGFPRRVTGLPLAMPQAWYGAQPVSFNRSWAPGASEGESSERGLWAHGHGAGADGVRGSRWLGQGPGQGALGWPSRPCPWRRV